MIEPNVYSQCLELMDGIYYSEKQSAVSYPEDGNEGCMQLEADSFWFRHRNECIKAVVSAFNENRVFWDIGGGNGYVSKGLQDMGVRTILLEPGEKGAKNARSRGLRYIICSTLEESGLKKGSIESAGLFDVIEHIKEDREFLCRLNELFSEKGMLYITVPSYRALWSEEDNNAGHYRRYTLGELHKLLNSAGFTVLYSTYIFSVLTIPIFISRTIPSLLGLRKKQVNWEKHKKEHRSQKRTGIFLERIWNWELARISKGKKIPFGSSCLVVARKTDQESYK